MARVFQGKITIPGDQIDTYLEALGQFEHEKAPLRTQLEHCARDFAHALAQQYAPKTVRKHTLIIELFIDFVCWDTDVRRLEEITRGWVGSNEGTSSFIGGKIMRNINQLRSNPPLHFLRSLPRHCRTQSCCN